MKKTLVALAVTAFAASASAVTVYDNEGTKFVVDGRVHVYADKETSKEGNAKTTGHSKLANNGSRVRFTVTHNITDDFYGFGRVELRFHGKDKTKLVKNEKYDSTNPNSLPYTLEEGHSTGSANWGNVYAHRGYVGLGSKSAGSEVTFGKMLLIGDDIGRIGLDNLYGVGSALSEVKGQSILTEATNSGVEYRFTGVKGLTLAANYNFATETDTVGSAKADYGVGAIYEFAVAEDATVSASVGYSHTDFQNVAATNQEDKDGVYGGVNYQNSFFKVGVDGGRAVLKAKNGDKLNTTSFVRTGAKFNVTDKAAVYGNYGYLTVKADTPKEAKTHGKNTAHRFMLGAEYKLHKQVKTYVEGKFDKIKFANGTKQKDKGIGVGLVAYF
ncbi:hypothetical protein A4G20_06040 [Pasteurellaceae bacterium RH1A]|nr:hypothetical protein A4G20_06040 [Pasteurellaceae bacterium RH1A]